MSKKSAEDIVFAWLGNIGRVPMEPLERQNAFKSLIDIFIHNGYTEDEISGPVCRGMIVRHSHNPNHKVKQKASRWKNLVETDLKIATISYFNSVPMPEKVEREVKQFPKYEPNEESVEATEVEEVKKEEPVPFDREKYGIPKPEVQFDPDMLRLWDLADTEPSNE